MEFLKQNWISILAVAISLFGIGYLVINKRWDDLRHIAYRFIRQAEKEITGTKMGQERFDFVLNQLYDLAPAWLRYFIPQSLLKQKLQEWFDLIKDSLDDGKINNSNTTNGAVS